MRDSSWGALQNATAAGELSWDALQHFDAAGESRWDALQHADVAGELPWDALHNSAAAEELRWDALHDVAAASEPAWDASDGSVWQTLARQGQTTRPQRRQTSSWPECNTIPCAKADAEGAGLRIGAAGLACSSGPTPSVHWKHDDLFSRFPRTERKALLF